MIWKNKRKDADVSITEQGISGNALSAKNSDGVPDVGKATRRSVKPATQGTSRDCYSQLVLAEKNKRDCKTKNGGNTSGRLMDK